MRAAFLIAPLWLTGCAAGNSETHGLMGRPVYEVTQKVGRPDRIVHGYMGMQAQELSVKYGQYTNDTPYQDLQYVATASPTATEAFDTYLYEHPRVDNGPHLNCTMFLIVNGQKTVQGWGSSCEGACPGGAETTQKWLTGGSFPSSCMVGG